MCGIFGIAHNANKEDMEDTLTELQTLCEMNFDRGKGRQHTITALYEDGSYKIENGEKPGWEDRLINVPKDITHFLGHSRASTNSTLPNNVQQHHPFEYRGYLLAHNGVLSPRAVAMLEDKYKAGPQVDSYYLLRHIYDEDIDTTYKLEGTFAFWLVRPAYISVFTNSNTVYYDKQSRMFSSEKIFDTDVLLTPGDLLDVTTFEIRGRYKVASPYLLL